MLKRADAAATATAAVAIAQRLAEKTRRRQAGENVARSSSNSSGGGGGGDDDDDDDESRGDNAHEDGVAAAKIRRSNFHLIERKSATSARAPLAAAAILNVGLASRRGRDLVVPSAGSQFAEKWTIEATAAASRQRTRRIFQSDACNCSLRRLRATCRL